MVKSGIHTLKAAINNDFNGQNKTILLDRFALIKERAEEYAEYGKVDPEEVFTVWETLRGSSNWRYFYQNYKTPCLKKYNVILHTDWTKSLSDSFGKDFNTWTFVCPLCGHVQSIKDFVSKGYPPIMAFTQCMGRYSNKVGCSWLSSGFTLNSGDVVLKDYKPMSVFKPFVKVLSNSKGSIKLTS